MPAADLTKSTASMKSRFQDGVRKTIIAQNPSKAKMNVLEAVRAAMKAGKDGIAKYLL